MQAGALTKRHKSCPLQWCAGNEELAVYFGQNPGVRGGRPRQGKSFSVAFEGLASTLQHQQAHTTVTEGVVKCRSAGDLYL